MCAVSRSRERFTADALHALADTELSLSSRLRYVALLLISLMVCGGVGSLWATEPELPARTHMAFAIILLIGLSWSTFAVQVLTGSRALLLRQRIVAGRMAVAFTSIYCAGALASGYAMGGGAAYTAAGFGGVMLVVAILMLWRAHRHFAAMSARREQLARELARNTP